MEYCRTFYNWKGLEGITIHMLAAQIRPLRHEICFMMLWSVFTLLGKGRQKAVYLLHSAEKHFSSFCCAAILPTWAMIISLSENLTANCGYFQWYNFRLHSNKRTQENHTVSYKFVSVIVMNVWLIRSLVKLYVYEFTSPLAYVLNINIL